MRRALIARLDNLGDVLVSGPAVRAVAAHPDVDEVWLLCSKQGEAAARLLPGVSRVVTWDCPWITTPSPGATREHLDALQQIVAACDPTWAVILTSFHQSPLPLALQLRLAGVRNITGASIDYAGSLLDTRLRPGEDFVEDQPEPLRALTIARAAGFDLPSDDDGALAVTGVEEASALVGTGGGSGVGSHVSAEPYVVVHPGVSVTARSWSEQKFAETVRILALSGIRTIVTGAPSERELTRVVAGEHGVDLGGQTPLPLLAGVLARAEVVIVANTGPAHLAAAVGTPIVSLFAPVVPAERWAPYGVPTVILGDQQAACAGSRARECPVPGHPCLSVVTPHDVVAAVRKLVPSLPLDKETAA